MEMHSSLEFRSWELIILPWKEPKLFKAFFSSWHWVRVGVDGGRVTGPSRSGICLWEVTPSTRTDLRGFQTGHAGQQTGTICSQVSHNLWHKEVIVSVIWSDRPLAFYTATSGCRCTNPSESLAHTKAARSLDLAIDLFALSWRDNGRPPRESRHLTNYCTCEWTFFNFQLDTLTLFDGGLTVGTKNSDVLTVFKVPAGATPPWGHLTNSTSHRGMKILTTISS